MHVPTFWGTAGRRCSASSPTSTTTTGHHAPVDVEAAIYIIDRGERAPFRAMGSGSATTSELWTVPRLTGLDNREARLPTLPTAPAAGHSF